jgi:hypothetical protein
MIEGTDGGRQPPAGADRVRSARSAGRPSAWAAMGPSPPPGRVRSPRSVSSVSGRLFLLAVALGTAMLLSVPPLAAEAPVRATSLSPVAVTTSSYSPQPIAAVTTGSGTPVNFSFLGPAAPLPPQFFGSTVTVDSGIVANESDFIRATPARLLVWPGGGFGDRYDPIAGILHSVNGAAPAASNETAFVALCRAVACHAIFQVPGEINSSAFAAQDVAYTEQTLGFHPDYWEIGNEPALWRHFNLPWAAWNRTQAIAPTPQAYAEEVLQYGQAMRSVDPTIRILGLPGVGEGGKVESTWMAAVASLDGSWISGLAVHAYPAGKGTKGASLSTFLGSLNNSNSLLSRIPSDRTALNASCGRCASLPLFVTELGTAVLSGTYDPYVEGFPDAVFLGAEVVQSLELNLTNIDTFGVRFTNPGSWENSTSYVRPSYTLFSDLLSRLGGEVQPLQPSLGIGGVYALESTRAGTSRVTDLFVVNSNSSSAIQISPGSIPGFPGGSAETWSWDGSTPAPMASYWPTGVPASWTVPSAGLLLVESSSPVSVPVILTETGLTAGTRWYASIANQSETSGSSHMTFFLPAGAYPVVASPPKRLPDGGREVEYAPGMIAVGSTPLGANVDFRVQYLLLLESTPSGAGETLPASGWYNATAPLALQAVARTGYAFVSWSHSGPSGYAGSLANASMSLVGQTVEIANFTAVPAGPDPPALGVPSNPSNGLLRTSLATPVAATLIGAAIVLNFHRHRQRAAGNPGSSTERPATPPRAPGKSRDSPQAGTPPMAGVRDPQEARRQAVLARARRLATRARGLAPDAPMGESVVEGLRQSLTLLRSSRIEEADRRLGETEREMDSAG